MEKNNKIVEVVKSENNQVDNLITQALKNGADVEVMERLFNLQREWKKDNAKEQFDLSMANFQGDCPTIKKTKDVKNKNGMLIYSYAPIDSIVSQVKNILKQNGLSYTFKTKINGEIKVICIIKHITGHQEESEMVLPKSGKGMITSQAQAIGGDVTFAKRYAFCNALGIMTGDEDSDALPEKNNDVEIPEKDIANIEECETQEDVKKVYDNFVKINQNNKAKINSFFKLYVTKKMNELKAKK